MGKLKAEKKKLKAEKSKSKKDKAKKRKTHSLESPYSTTLLGDVPGGLYAPLLAFIVVPRRTPGSGKKQFSTKHGYLFQDCTNNNVLYENIK
uniref:Uncharacterized protein n=1 Tax=Romanomermis culicivorax TaxID=13658 RepID=A0A915KBF3_ROMCU